MKAHLCDLPQALAAPVTEALGALGWAVSPQTGAADQAQPAELLVIAASTAEAAQAAVAAFAKNAPPARTEGADLRADAQVVWLLPRGTASAHGGAVQRLALDHAPQLRVNALHLGPRHAPAPDWQAAWHAAQPHPAPLALPQALELAFALVLETASMTGQVINLSTSPKTP